MKAILNSLRPQCRRTHRCSRRRDIQVVTEKHDFRTIADFARAISHFVDKTAAGGIHLPNRRDVIIRNYPSLAAYFVRHQFSDSDVVLVNVIIIVKGLALDVVRRVKIDQ